MMIELQDIASEMNPFKEGPVKGFTTKKSEDYDETVFAFLMSKETLYIGTKNDSASDSEDVNRWVVTLNKEQVQAFACHLLTLARDME